MDAAAIDEIAHSLCASAGVLAECAARVGAIEFGPAQAGRAHAAAGQALQAGFAHLGQALIRCSANASRSGTLLRSNSSAVVAGDHAFARRLAGADR